MKVSFREHGEIVEAILSGNTDGAREGLRSHVAVQGDRFGDLVANLSNRERRSGRLG